MKVKSLPYHLCNTSVAWHDVNDVGVAEVFCRNCVSSNVFNVISSVRF